MLFLFLCTFVFVSICCSFANGRRFYVTAYGVCVDCALHNENYQWCNLGKSDLYSWDYCSTLPGHSSTNKPCKEEHTCGFHGYKYLWCYLKNGGCDYCSHIEDTTLVEYTSPAYGNATCQNYCDMVDGSYRCREKEGGHSFPCAPVRGLTSKGKFCWESTERLTFCGEFINGRWEWCYVNLLWHNKNVIGNTHPSSWGYCSTPSSDVFEEALPELWKKTGRIICRDGRSLTMDLVHLWYRHLANGGSVVTSVFAEKGDLKKLSLVLGNNREKALDLVYSYHKDNTQVKYDMRLEAKLSGDYYWDVTLLSGNGDDTLVFAHVKVSRSLPQVYTTREIKRTIAYGLYQSLIRTGTVWITQQRMYRNESFRCPGVNI